MRKIKLTKEKCMGKKKGKRKVKPDLIDLLRHRIHLLEGAKLHYEQNPTLMPNLKMANIEIIQNDIEVLKEILSRILTGDTSK